MIKYEYSKEFYAVTCTRH